MGIQGTVEYFSTLLCSVRKGKKKKQMQTVALKVRMDCEGCERKVKNVLSRVKGVKSVDVDLKHQKATVNGYVEPEKVLKAAQSTMKKVEMWPYVPYTLVAHPYVSQAYDKKAPPNHVRAIPATATISEATVDDNYTTMFSDENPNACSIMTLPTFDEFNIDPKALPIDYPPSGKPGTLPGIHSGNTFIISTLLQPRPKENSEEAHISQRTTRTLVLGAITSSTTSSAERHSTNSQGCRYDKVPRRHSMSRGLWKVNR